MDLIDFWFENKKNWFNCSKEFDKLVTDKYEYLFKQNLNHWKTNPIDYFRLILEKGE